MKIRNLTLGIVASALAAAALPVTSPVIAPAGADPDAPSPCVIFGDPPSKVRQHNKDRVNTTVRGQCPQGDGTYVITGVYRITNAANGQTFNAPFTLYVNAGSDAAASALWNFGTLPAAPTTFTLGGVGTAGVKAVGPNGLEQIAQITLSDISSQLHS